MWYSEEKVQGTVLEQRGMYSHSGVFLPGPEREEIRTDGNGAVVRILMDWMWWRGRMDLRERTRHLCSLVEVRLNVDLSISGDGVFQGAHKKNCGENWCGQANG